MKKLINKILILTFSLSPIAAISSSPTTSTNSDSPQSELSQSFKTKLKKSFKNSKWVSQTKSNSGSNIIVNLNGAIFEDSRGNLWSMGRRTPLQRYDYQTKWWTPERSRGEGSSGSNIIDGDGGTIFEDSRGNLWSMGSGTPLQRYDYNTKRWTPEGSSGSNITDGVGGTIFEDSRGNLWSMGFGTPLQKYDYNTKKWTEETNANSNSNITNGVSGTIFEDSRGNLWSMGSGTPLQKYNYETKRWTTQTSESSGSNIYDGESGSIFEDTRGNLWIVGKRRPLQSYNYNTKKWTKETKESSGSNITNGYGGTIFEDSRGNLWSMGAGTPLQKYDYTRNRWTAETKESSDSNIINAAYGTIFEDSRGNLWSMGYKTQLQKYNYETKRWTTQTSESSGSNIIDGGGGTIFEDSRGNLWSMGSGTSLQKLTPTKETNLDTKKAKNFDIKLKTKIKSDSKISILIKGYREYTSDLFTHLRYKKVAESSWKIVKKRTMILDAAEYEFKWVIGTEEILANKQNLPQKIIIKSNGSVGNIIFFQQQMYIAKVKTFLNKLSSEAIRSLVNNSKWISSITKLEVLTLIQANSGYSELTNNQQTLITKDLITTTEEPAGTLKVTITYDGQTKVLLAPGFLTIAQDNINKVKAFFAGLSNGDINSLAASNKLVGAINADQVLAKLQTLSAYNDLTAGQKALVTTNLITTTKDSPGTLKVTITFKGETYELIKDGFKLSLEAEANKFQDFISNDTTQSKAANLKASSKNVLSIFKTISGYQRPANLASDSSITNVIVKNALNSQTQKVTFELTVTRQGEEPIKKDINVTFKAFKVIPKPSKKESNKKESSGLSTRTIVRVALGSIFGIGIIGFLIFYFAKKSKNARRSKK